MKHFLLSIAAMISFSSFAQKQFINCETQKPIANLMVFDATEEYIGITNAQGILERPINSEQVIVNHPEYGNQKIEVSDEKRICVDLFNEELDELFIEKGAGVRKELLQALEISYKAFNDANSKKAVYKIEDYAFVDNILIESLKGYLKINGNGKGIRFLNPEYGFTEYSHTKKYGYYILPQYSAFALDEQLFPLHNKKDYEQFVTFVGKNEISKSGAYYYIDLPNIDDFITIEIVPESQKIARISFPKVQKDGRRKLGTFTQYVNTEMFFDVKNSYKMTKLELKNYYVVDGKKAYYDFRAVEVNLPKKEVSAMDSHRVYGGLGLNSLVNVYMNQRRNYNSETLGIDKLASPWYYR